MRRDRNPIKFKPTKATASSTGHHFHTNFADENILASTVGFLNGTGYLDERLLPGSHVLRHKLPPVKLRRSASSPAHCEDNLQFLSEMKALEGCMGEKGIRLVTNMKKRASGEKMDAAFVEGDMKALRAAVRGGQWGSRLHKDPRVLFVNSLVSKYDKCLMDCRNGMAAKDMIRVQLAMSHIDEIAEAGLGPRLMENQTLIDAKSALAKWVPFRPYLHKLGTMLLSGPMPFAQYWLVLVEGTLLSAELENSASADLARFGQAGVDALEEALLTPEVRYHYQVPWPQKNPLPQQVRGRLAYLGVDVTDLKIRIVRERAASGWPEADALASLVITGPLEVLNHMANISNDIPEEPLAAGRPAELDTAEKRDQRAAAHRERLEQAWAAVQEEERNKVPEAATEGFKIPAAKKFKDLPPNNGPFYGPRMFTKTV